MRVLITGASSGIGRDMARVFSKMGAELYLVARRTDRLEALRDELGTPCRIFDIDLSVENNCRVLYETLKTEEIDVLVNNAGFGAFGEFAEIPLERELEMVDVNVRALHILTKLFLADFRKRNRGYILNVSSVASFLQGPLLATYYATKAYVTRLTLAIYEELRREKSAVYIGALCPGPVDTEFNDRANAKFMISGHSSKMVAEYAIKKMFKGKTIIIPGVLVRMGVFFQRFVPTKLLLKVMYLVQNEKKK